MQKIALSAVELDRLRAACAAGAEPQPPMDGEVFRFRSAGGVLLARACHDGGYSLSPGAFAALQKLRGPGGAPQPTGEAAMRLAGELMLRDGRRCFYCDVELTDGRSPTVEHLLSKSRGGSDDLANLALACKPCNQAVADRPIVQKVRFRDERRRAGAPPRLVVE